VRCGVEAPRSRPHRPGATLKTVQDQIGHASLTTTADLYTSTLPETAQRAAEAAANLIKFRLKVRPTLRPRRRPR
jgi:integrase